MLYNTFCATLMICAVLGVVDMIYSNHTEYIYFPIAIVFWGVYTYVYRWYMYYQRIGFYDKQETETFQIPYSKPIVKKESSTIYHNCYKKCKQSNKIKFYDTKESKCTTS